MTDMAGDICQALNVGGQNLAAAAAATDAVDESNNDDDDDAPSELLTPLLEEWNEVLVKHVLERLDPTDCAMLARVGKPWLAVLVANSLPRAGNGGAVRLALKHFCGSVKWLAWAKDNGCPWDYRTCLYIAKGGNLEVLQWARERGCPWDEWTCRAGAYTRALFSPT